MTSVAEAFVVDASVAVKWQLTDEVLAAEAGLLLRRLSLGDAGLAAPAQIRYEVPSAITAATLGRDPRLSHEQGRRAIERFLSIDLVLFDNDELITGAYPLVHQHGIAFYDALYLALAQRLGIRFITADRKLHHRIQHLPEVLWLGNYQPAT
jgi:predicted nucleic acid-binding protein